jgi:hypothetical protein
MTMFACEQVRDACPVVSRTFPIVIDLKRQLIEAQTDFEAPHSTIAVSVNG